MRTQNVLWNPCIERLSSRNLLIPSLTGATPFETVMRHTLCSWPSGKAVKLEPTFLISEEFVNILKVLPGIYERNAEKCAEYFAGKRKRNAASGCVELLSWKFLSSKAMLKVVWNRYPNGRKLSVQWNVSSGSHPLEWSWRDDVIKSRIFK